MSETSLFILRAWFLIFSNAEFLLLFSVSKLFSTCAIIDAIGFFNSCDTSAANCSLSLKRRIICFVNLIKLLWSRPISSFLEASLVTDILVI